MTPERLHRIRAVYEAAVDSPAAGRQALLDHECEGDQDLRKEVERLLGAREHLPGWFSGPLLGAAHPDHADAHSTMTQPAGVPKVRFHPGAHLGQRYCIVYSLGRGGMGEVYRADDLVLGQPVALKFLPAANETALSRFRNEVRTARQISHSNVCRVYDIGEADGLTYLSMEYVDGEDLASLLRRIGKLSQDKALEIARQLCAGLAAAHDKGVIHRDLKPANIMLDGRGHVRITDFGIAGMAAQIRDVRSGTPAYMSPEQLAGKEVTARSDIYALGIVLCELLTGKRPPLEVGGADMDPVVEQVIQRCLDSDPRMRPRSALAVSAALPGSDPLAVALARGETPAPEVVANAGPVEGLRPWVAAISLAVVIVGLGLLCVLRQKHDLINQVPMENSSEVLAAKAREIAKSFGYTDRPADTLFGWSYDTDFLTYAREQNGRSASERRFYTAYPPAVYFWYRQGAFYPISINLDEELSVFRRENLEPGMQAVVLDSEGRLLEFYSRPPIDLPRNSGAPRFDWHPVFVAAGLEPGGFESTEPHLTPTTPFDTEAAWTGSWSAGPSQRVRIEAAAFRGHLVFFRVLGPWARQGQSLRQPVSYSGLSFPLFVLSVIVLPAIGGLLAWRNARSGRADRQAAFRLASIGFVCELLGILVSGHHTSTSAEFLLLFAGLRSALVVGALYWVIYMALEPQVRRRSPTALISWRRLLAGRLRDPLAGGHVLIGIALGIAALCFAEGLLTPPGVSAGLSRVPVQLPGSAGALLGVWLWAAIVGVAGGVLYMFILSLILIPLRRGWLALSIFVLLLTLVLTQYATGPALAVGRSIVFFGMVAIALARFGVLSAAAAIYAQIALLEFPLTTNWSAWYAPAAVLGIATLVALALYGFLTTLSGQRLWPATMDAS